jgi:hypothetical protein
MTELTQRIAETLMHRVNLLDLVSPKSEKSLRQVAG